MTSLLELRDKVQRALSEHVGSLSVGPEGVFSFRNESTRVFVRCWEEPLLGEEPRTLVNIMAPVVMNVPSSAALHEHLVLNSGDWFFGHLSTATAPDGGGLNVFVTHTLLGDYLDAEELRTAAIVVALAANRVDDEIQSKFGGTRFHED